ncbi:PKD domain-containing protein [bacterium SCSIO 12741]|nr:PKD domain-containing protein [bacterium SCSIO 12741]
MKLFNRFTLLFIALFFTGSLFAQSAYQERIERMHEAEARINKYIQEHLDAPIPQDVIDDYLHSMDEEKDAHGHPLMTDAEKEGNVERLKYGYWRTQYFIDFPDEVAVYAASPVSNCNNGDFELGNFTGYTLASGNTTSGNGYTSGECSFIPLTAVTTLTPEAPFSNTDNFQLVGPGSDPYVPIQRVNTAAGLGDNWAVRINGGKPLANPITSSQCWPDRGINRLSRTVTLSSAGISEVGFYYALVMEYPNHTNANPFFVARAMDASGNELDRVCRISNPGDPFFNSVPSQSYGGCGISQTVYSDWTCGELEVSGNVGDVITLEFYAVDCGAGAHFGYAYVDDICEDCVADSCNFQGSIDLDPAKDTCFTGQKYDVCGTFDMAAINCTTATVNSITLNVIQGGVSTPVTVTPTIDLVNKTFCFSLSPGDFPSASGSYDFEVTIEFAINGGTHTETDVHTVPGQDNDVSFDCCDFVPQIVIQGDTCIDPCENPEIPVIAYVIDANTGLPMTSPPNTISWSTGATTTYTTAFVNTPLTVTVTDDKKCTETDSTYIPCDSCDCKIKDFTLFAGTPNKCQVGFSAWNYSTTSKDCEPIKVIWNWGDGTTSEMSPLVSPLHTYSSNGTYTVCASVVVQSGSDPKCTDTLTKCVVVRIEKCDDCKCDIRDFTLKNTMLNGCQAGFSAYNFSITPEECKAVKILWDFGDGTTVSLAPNVSAAHTYSSNGTYTVCATVIVESSIDPKCTDQLKKCITVNITNCRRSSGSIAPPHSNGSGSGTPGQGDFSVYPNPTNGDIFVFLPTENAERLRLQVVSVEGKVLMNQEVINQGEEIQLSTSELSEGTYYLKAVREDGSEHVRSFIKE